MSQYSPVPYPPRSTVVLGGPGDESPRLEVFADRIRLTTGATSGMEWRRADGGHATVRRSRHGPELYIGAGDGQSLPLDPFDLAEVRSALLAHGWSWEQDGRVTPPNLPAPDPYTVAPSPPAAAETELVLKAPKATVDMAALTKRMTVVIPLLLIVVVVPATMGLVFLGVDIMWPVSTIAGLGMAGVIVLTVQLLRATGLSVTIGRDRVVVRRGSNTETVERARLRGPGKVGKYYITFKVGDSFRDEVAVPARIRREELLAQLSAHGWRLENE